MSQFDDDTLERMLRAPADLHGGGFTHAVLRALPPQRDRRLRPIVLLSATALAGGLGLLWLALPAMQWASIQVGLYACRSGPLPLAALVLLGVLAAASFTAAVQE